MSIMKLWNEYANIWAAQNLKSKLETKVWKYENMIIMLRKYEHKMPIGWKYENGMGININYEHIMIMAKGKNHLKLW